MSETESIAQSYEKRGHVIPQDIIRIFGQRVESIELVVREGEKEHRTAFRLSPGFEPEAEMGWAFSADDWAAMRHWFGDHVTVAAGVDVTAKHAAASVVVNFQAPPGWALVETGEREFSLVFQEVSP